MTQIIYPPKRIGDMKDLEFETTLPKARLAYILWFRFFEPYRKKTRNTLAKELGVSVERIVQLEQQAIRKIENAAHFYKENALSLFNPLDDE